MASFGAPLGFNTKTQSRTQGTGLDDHRSYLTNKRTGVSDMAVLLRLPHVETQRRIKDDATRVVTSQSDRRNDNLLSPNQAQSSPQLQSSPSTLLEPFSFNPQSSSSTSPSSQTNPTTSNQSHVLKSHCKHQRNEGPRECETQRLQAMEPAQVRLQNLQASRTSTRLRECLATPHHTPIGQTLLILQMHLLHLRLHFRLHLRLQLQFHASF